MCWYNAPKAVKVLLIWGIKSKKEKVPRGIQGEKSRNDMASLGLKQSKLLQLFKELIEGHFNYFESENSANIDCVISNNICMVICARSSSYVKKYQSRL